MRILRASVYVFRPSNRKPTRISRLVPWSARVEANQPIANNRYLFQITFMERAFIWWGAVCPEECLGEAA